MPDASTRPGDRLGRWWWAVGLGIAAVVVVAAALLASADPDGLERVGEDQGFLESARDALYSLIPDYAVPGVEGAATTILAGLLGVAVVAGLMYGLGRLLARRRA